jgi:hypothetical protein
MNLGRVLGATIALLALAGCNPLLGDPATVGDFDEIGARYSGPADSWIEIAVSGAPSHSVYALALIRSEDLTGPTSRDCGDSGGAPVPCDVSVVTVQMPSQRLVRGDGSEFARLITMWPDERVSIALVCVDPVTDDRGCPTTLRTALRVVDDAGSSVGDLIPARA